MSPDLSATLDRWGYSSAFLISSWMAVRLPRMSMGTSMQEMSGRLATGSAHERAHRGPHDPPRPGDRPVQQRPAHWLRCREREYQAGIRDRPPRILGRGVPEQPRLDRGRRSLAV